MKITFVTATLTSGGSERVISILANELANRGHNVSIILLREPIVFYDINDNVNIVFANDYCKNLLSKILWLRKHVKANAPDIVIPFMTAIYCITILSLLGTSIPIISSERIDPRYSSKLRRFLRWLLLRFTSHLVVQTNEIKQFYSKKIQAKTSIIANPVSEDVFHDYCVKKEKQIINVGRLYDQKNHMLLIDAFCDIANKYPEYKLTIYGEGPLRNTLTEHIASLGLQDRVFLPGRSEQIIIELQKSEIFCLSSDYEGMSNALIEAMCVGLPIVTTRVSGVDDMLINGTNAIIVPVKSRQKLAEALDKIIASPQIRNTFARNNKNAANKYRTENIIRSWEQVIMSTINKSK